MIGILHMHTVLLVLVRLIVVVNAAIAFEKGFADVAPPALVRVLLVKPIPPRL